MIVLKLLTDIADLIDQYLAINFERAVNKGEEHHHNPEILHQLRVKTRTLLSLIDPEHQEHHVLLKKVLKKSNAIRDLDVLLFEVLKSLPTKTQQTTKLLEHRLNEQKIILESYYQIFLRKKVRPILIQLANEESDYISNRKSNKKPIQKLPLKEIDKAFVEIKVALSDPEISHKQLHKLRLRVKKLRYQVIHHYEQETTLLNELKNLQTLLGQFHDIDQAYMILREHLTISQLELFEHISTQLNKQQQKILKQIINPLKK